MYERLLADLRGRMGEAEGHRFAAAVRDQILPAAFDPFFALAFPEHHGHARRNVRPLRGEPGLEDELVPLHHHIRRLEVAQSHVEGIPALADADEIQRHPGPRGFAPGLRQVVPGGGHAVRKGDDRGERSAAEVLQHRLNAVAQPARFPLRFQRFHGLPRRGGARGIVERCDQPNVVRHRIEVNLQLFVIQKFLDPIGFGAEQQLLGEPQAIHLAGEFAAELPGLRTHGRILQIVLRGHAGGTIQYDGDIRVAFAVEGQLHLRKKYEGDHAHGPEPQREGNKHPAEAVVRAAFEPVDAEDRRGRHRVDKAIIQRRLIFTLDEYAGDCSRRQRVPSPGAAAGTSSVRSTVPRAHGGRKPRKLAGGFRMHHGADHGEGEHEGQRRERYPGVAFPLHAGGFVRRGVGHGLGVA